MSYLKVDRGNLRKFAELRTWDDFHWLSYCCWICRICRWNILQWRSWRQRHFHQKQPKIRGVAYEAPGYKWASLGGRTRGVLIPYYAVNLTSLLRNWKDRSVLAGVRSSTEFWRKILSKKPPFVRPLAAATLLLHRRLNQPSARKGSTGWRCFRIWSGWWWWRGRKLTRWTVKLIGSFDEFAIRYSTYGMIATLSDSWDIKWGHFYGLIHASNFPI